MPPGAVRVGPVRAGVVITGRSAVDVRRAVGGAGHDGGDVVPGGLARLHESRDAQLGGVAGAASGGGPDGGHHGGDGGGLRRDGVVGRWHRLDERQRPGFGRARARALEAQGEGRGVVPLLGSGAAAQTRTSLSGPRARARGAGCPPGPSGWPRWYRRRTAPGR